MLMLASFISEERRQLGCVEARGINRLLHETISAGIVSEIKGSNITDAKSHITYTNC